MTILARLRGHWPLIVLNLVILLFFLFHASGIIRWNFIEQMENLAYDTRVLLSTRQGQDPRIVIVDIDEKSLAVEGRWPWGRDKLARMLDILFEHYQASLVGFDIVFAEPDDSSGLKILEDMADNELQGVPEFREQLQKIRPQLNYDRIFARSMANRPVILGYYFNAAGSGKNAITSGALPEPVLTGDEVRGWNVKAPRADGYGANLPILQEHAAGAGHFNPTIDSDGIIRRIPLLYQYKEDYYESLSLAIARQALGIKRVEPVFADDIARNYRSLEWLRFGRNLIPVDDKVQALVPYRGQQNSYPYVPATDVLNKIIDKSVMENTIVLVGTSAPGLFDLRSTPVQNKYPGVEVQANMIAGLIDQSIKQRPAYIKGIEFVILLLIGFLIIIFLPLLTPLWEVIFTLILSVTTIYLNYYIWDSLNIVLPVASGLMMILGMYLMSMSYGFFTERRIKGEITDLFGQYVPPELVDEMSNNPQDYSQEAEDREMTVLFSDVRGFTTLSEGLPPAELSEMMNEFLTSLTRIIHEHRGTIDKYMGDAVMAFWGAPVEDEDHALHALQAAMAMIRKMYDLHDEFESRGWPRLRIGVGLNTGVMSVGNMGSRFRTAYTAIGDEVNLGSRLEGLTKEYGVDLIVGESTKRSVPEYTFRRLDIVRVKGKDRPVVIYEPLGRAEEISETTKQGLKHYQNALGKYYNQQWDQAEKLFRQLNTQEGYEQLIEIYLERIKLFRQNPPGPDWDGAFTYTTK